MRLLYSASAIVTIYGYILRILLQSCLMPVDNLCGGVATIIAGLKLYKPVVVVPRHAQYAEHVDDHQVQIAESFSEKNLLVMCRQPEELAEAVSYARTHTFAKYVSQRDLVITTIREYLENI